MRNIKYGDTVTFTAINQIKKGIKPSRLGIYQKGVYYAVVGNRKDDQSVAAAYDWVLVPPDDKTNGDDIEYGDSFYLFNVVFDRYLTDDKTSQGFNGADGYLGLVEKNSGLTGNGKNQANQYKLTKKFGNKTTGPIEDDAMGLTLEFYTKKWARNDYPLKVYWFNAGMYLRWDERSSDYTEPKYKVMIKPTAGTMTSGWDIVCANQKDVVNSKLKKMYDTGKLLHKMGPLKAGCPEVSGKGMQDQRKMEVTMSIDGSMAPLISINGNMTCTIDLEAIDMKISSENRTDYLLRLNVVGNLFYSVDLSQVDVRFLGIEGSITDLEGKILEEANTAYLNLQSVTIPFKMAVPISLKDVIVKPVFVVNSSNENKSYFAIVIGLHGKKGTYHLSKGVIYNSVNSTTAFVFSNQLFITVCREMLNKFFGSDFKFEISKTANSTIINSEEVFLKEDSGFFAIQAAIKRGGFVFKLDGNGGASLNVGIGYQITKPMPWSHVKIYINTMLTAENGELVLNLKGSGEPPIWLYIIWLPLALILKSITREGQKVIPIPHFYCDEISAPTYIQLSGKWI